VTQQVAGQRKGKEELRTALVTAGNPFARRRSAGAGNRDNLSLYVILGLKQRSNVRPSARCSGLPTQSGQRLNSTCRLRSSACNAYLAGVERRQPSSIAALPTSGCNLVLLAYLPARASYQPVIAMINACPVSHDTAVAERDLISSSG
jgi:hypothetical protein